MRGRLGWACAALVFGACVGDDDDSVAPDDEDDDAGSDTTVVSGRVFDEDTTAAVADCEVGVRRSQAVRTTREGRFSIEVERGGAFNVRCEGAIVRSFQLPDVEAVDWEINVDFWGVDEEDVDCLLNVTADFSGLGLEAEDGVGEVGILGVGRGFQRPVEARISYLGVLSVAPGPFRVYGRAFGGILAGFGTSDVMTCPGDGSVIEVDDVVVELSGLTVREGSWSDPGDEATLEIFGPWQDDEPDLDGADLRIDHLLTAREDGFEVSVQDFTDGAVRARACRRGTAGDTCIHRVDIAPDADIDIGALPRHVIVGAQLGSGRIRLSTDRDLESGSVTAFLLDTTDFTPRPVWKAWSPTGALDISTEWLGTVPPADFLTLLASGQENVTFDFASDFAQVERGDGWIELTPRSTRVGEED